MKTTPFPTYVTPRIRVTDVKLQSHVAVTGFTSDSDNNEDYSDGGEFVW